MDLFKLICIAIYAIAATIILGGLAVAPLVHRWAYKNKYTVKTWDEFN